MLYPSPTDRKGIILAYILVLDSTSAYISGWHGSKQIRYGDGGIMVIFITIFRYKLNTDNFKYEYKLNIQRISEFGSYIGQIQISFGY
jgi:hypothetical protein